ncbi:MAG: TatD family hydrolase [Clostridiales bacterium]|jgi:TatD DNase family protein|nr:TatD family hydrolase [Clostridiales bacterium]
MYFETHCHYDFKQYNDDRREVLAGLPAAGVSYALNIGTTLAGSRASVALAREYDYIYATVGFHPHNAKEMREGDIDILADLALDPKVVGIGEIGLDFHYDFSPRDVQRARFKEQLQLALDLQLPLVIHSREAEAETLKILEESRAGELVGGIMHCFSAGPATAQKYLNLGWHIGVGGVVTYKNAAALREVVAITPHNRLVIETDCPYLSPEPKRGSRNDSANLRYIAEKIAEIWNVPQEEVAKITTDNAKRLFGINIC